MKRKHEMPFGAEVRADGTTRFRLWAPKTSSIALQLKNPERALPMSKSGEGWFELTTTAPAGTEYSFLIDEKQPVPDPASRFQPSGVHGPSEVIEPAAYEWKDAKWKGRPWDESVIYELHVGTFSAEGDFAGVESKLDYLAGLGVTAVELMPLGSFPGERNWGYDGVLLFAPTSRYGRPEDLKRLIDAAHAKNLMVFLDVIYNHFGPEGDYLNLYAPEFFTDRYQTPWGRAIDFDGPNSRWVRSFFIHNAMYWLEEYHFDGLRLDAVHAIHDESQPDILTELAETVRTKFAEKRQVHLILENDDNAARYLCRAAASGSSCYDAQWNDDIHHALHVLLTGEADGYYSDYSKKPTWQLGRCLAEGYGYQSDSSAFRQGAKRGERSRDLPPTRFVSFLQNHDQIGNRAFGERITRLADAEKVKLAMTILLLAPSPPLLFMGEEFAADTPFLFFCDFGPELAARVSQGRRAEFARFEQFSSPLAQAKIPDPNEEETFLRSKIDWDSVEQAQHRNWLEFYRDALRCRHEKIVPRIKDIVAGKATFKTLGAHGLEVQWPFAKSGNLELVANFDQRFLTLHAPLKGELLYTNGKRDEREWKEMPPLTAAWFLNA